MPKSLGINLANCVLDKLTHNNEMVKMLRFAGQTHNSRKLYISPTQSTFCSKYILRAQIHETIPIEPEYIPKGSLFKGYNDFVVQGLKIETHNVCNTQAKLFATLSQTIGMQ
jgi:hypothetical protein